MRITEIFFSIQGESTHAGKPCIFVRLTGCSLRCGYCDTKYSYSGGEEVPLQQVLTRIASYPARLKTRIASYPARLVEVTGGEPLEQEEVYPLMDALLKNGYTVMLETGGHVSVERVPKGVIKIIDVKTPGSREGDTFRPENLDLAAPHDEYKFVITSRTDYEWSRDFLLKELRDRANPVLFSPSHEELPARDLAAWILEDNLPVRLQLQAHKYIWGAHVRGV